MSSFVALLRSINQFAPDVLLIVGAVVTLCTGLAGLIKTVVVVLHWQGGRLDHLGNALLGAGADVAKVKAGIANAIAGGAVQTVAKIMVLVALVPLLSCARLKPVEPQLVDCEAKAIAQAAESLIPQVSTILSGMASGVDYSQQLDRLLVAQGAALVCAVEVVVSYAELQGTGAAAQPARWDWPARPAFENHPAGPPGSSSDPGPAWLVCSRGHSWLQALHVRHPVHSVR